MKTKRLLFLSIICALVLASCASAQRSAATSMPASKSVLGSTTSVEVPNAAPVPTIANESLDASTANATSGSSGYSSATTDTVKQMVIQNASLTILVDDPSVSLSDIMKMASDMGGFTVSSNRYQTATSSGDEVPQASVTIRVPADQLNTALDKIKALTGNPEKFVTDESVTGQDVTQQYTDLQSRLRNLEEASDELSKMYDKATKSEDVLAIYNQKMQVNEQIEVLKGQIQYYSEAAAKSAITVQIEAKAANQPITVAGWQPQGIAKEALQALVNFFKGLVNFLIWFVILVIPILVIIGLPLFFLVRWLARRKKAAQEKSKQIPPLPVNKE